MSPRSFSVSSLFSVVLVVAMSSCGAGYADEAPPVAATWREPPPGMEMVLPTEAAPSDAGLVAEPFPAQATDAGFTEVGAPGPDAGVVADVGSTRDAGTTPLDAGSTRDAGTAPLDAGSPRDAGAATIDAGAPAAPRDGGLWVSGYYPGWTRSSLPPAEIDFRALTHLVDFSLHPLTDGTLEDTHSILPSSATTIAAAHAAGVKVLVCIGGANTVSGFQSATTPARLATFVDNLITVITRYGYDGIDLDWEPLSTTDRPQYLALVNALHDRLAALSPRGLLTAAVDSWASSTLTLVADRFDQINVMTYDMVGTGSDWVTWFNSPLSAGGLLRPSGNPMPAADLSVQNFRNNGLAASKLGIGIAFYGYLWTGGAGTSTGGVTAPHQSWTSAPSVSAIDYRTIQSTWYQPSRYHHDAASASAWLSIDQPGSANDAFLAYDDEATIAAKLAWAKSHGIGGVIIWQLGGGYLPTAPAGQRDPLLQAVRANR